MPPSLLSLLFGEVAAEITGVSPRLQRWSAVFGAWLAFLETTRGHAAFTLALRTWKLLLEFRPCPPWLVDSALIDAWLAHLLENDYTRKTAVAYRGFISAFYRFCAARPEMASDPLFAAPGPPFTPVRGAAGLQERKYENAYILHPAEARALLHVIDRRASLQGRRDYAFILAMLLTGVEEFELRHLHWQDLRFTPSGVELLLPGHPEPRPLLPAAWQALLEYLHTSGRLPVMQPADYIFCRLANPLLRPGAASPADWLPGQPLSTEYLLVYLKAYASWAGLNANRVTYACLRHTAVALRLEAGDDVAALQKFLNFRAFKDTRIYFYLLRHILAARGKPRPPWVRRSLGLTRFGQYQRKHPYGQEGSRSRFKHGFYTRRWWLDGDFKNLDAKQLQAIDLENEITGLRVVVYRLHELIDSGDDPAQLLHLIELFGRSCTRISRLVNKQSTLRKDIFHTQVEQAVDQFWKDRQARGETLPSPDLVE